jgi:hypothetical protein
MQICGRDDRGTRLLKLRLASLQPPLRRDDLRIADRQQRNEQEIASLKDSIDRPLEGNAAHNCTEADLTMRLNRRRAEGTTR